MSALNVLGLFTSGKDPADPLASPRVAAAWLRQLPSLDVVGRQQHVMRAFETMRVSRKPADLNRMAAVAFLDGTLGGDRRQLMKQFVENVETSTQLANRLWQALYDMVQGFVTAYQSVLEEALEQPQAPRWKPVTPVLFARLVHYYGTDAKLRVFRFERWIPAKWMELNRLFLRAVELGVERVPTTLPNASAATTAWSIEQEYIFVLLMHQLNTGNLSPAQLDWASAQLRGWCRRLALDAIPRSPEGFYIDLSGKSGIARRVGGEKGATLRYLDTTPLMEQIERAIAALREAQEGDHGNASSINLQRIAILERMRPAVAPNHHLDLRRDERVYVHVAARVRVGLSRICQDLTGSDASGSTGEIVGAAEHIEVYAIEGAARTRRTGEDTDSLVASLTSFSEPMWQVKDRSLAGLRIGATGGVGQSLALGALVAVRQSDVSDWVLGVVRRLNKASNDESEAGLAIVSEHIVPVTLHSRRETAKQSIDVAVNGVETSTLGGRFEGLYLPPPSRPERPLTVKTLIVPSAEYVEGRQIMLTTGRSLYTIALRHLIEQRPDWTWAAIQIVEKKPRPL